MQQQGLPAQYLKDRLPARVRSVARREWRYNGKNEEFDPEKFDGACKHEFPWVLWVAEGLLNERDCDIACMVGSGYTQKEIAERLGLSQQAVSCRIARIRGIMEKEMGNSISRTVS